MAPAAAVRTGMTVREYGRLVLTGGVGMLDGADLSLPYPCTVLMPALG